MSEINITELKVGQKVRYQPDYYGPDRWENGIIKEIPEGSKASVRVVYNCGNDWENYTKYTSALTNIADLKLGWRSYTVGEEIVLKN